VKDEKKYIEHMKRAGWKLESNTPGSICFSSPTPPDIVRAMKKANKKHGKK
jgi:hypothetical protein